MLPHMTLENMMGFYGSQDDMGLELQVGWDLTALYIIIIVPVINYSSSVEVKTNEKVKSSTLCGNIMLRVRK